jgi:hypothetical protein
MGQQVYIDADKTKPPQITTNPVKESNSVP